MRKESQPYNQLSDGSWDLGNGVISASLSDRDYFNSLSETRKGKTNRLILPVTTAILGGIGVACSGGGNKNTVENTESSGYELPFPKGETWYLTGGPHADGLSNGVRYAIDIAPPELGRLNGQCPTDGSRLVIENRVVTASASGEVIVAGDDKNRSDPSHSMIKIKDAKGLTEVYIHAANIKVKKGDKVKQGAPLANPSCEYPPGGRNDGAHVHEGLEKDGQAIPIDGVEIGGWTIHNEPKNYDGTMTKPGEKTRTAITGRCADDKVCGGIRNDLISGPIKQVLGESTGPTATAKPIESKKPTQAPVEKQPEQGWTRFRSLNYPYQIDYPRNWLAVSSKDVIEGNKVDILSGPTIQGVQLQILIYAEPIASHVTFDDYLKQMLNEMQLRSGRRWSQKEYDQTLENFKNDSEEGGPMIDGKRVSHIQKDLNSAWISKGKEGLSSYSIKQITYEQIFLARGQAWHLQLTRPQYFGNPIQRLEDEWLASNPLFEEKIVPSFKFLK